MIVKCEYCFLTYDDAQKFTFCPHDYLMPLEDLERKKLAIKLLSRRVKFHHEPDSVSHKIQSITYKGMIILEDLVGEFSPYLFKIVDS